MTGNDLVLALPPARFDFLIFDFDKFEKKFERLVEMTGNDLVLALPPAVKDAVGADINDIPRALQVFVCRV